MYCILFLLITWISIQCIELDFLLKPPFNFFESKMTDAHACTWLHKPILQVQQIWKWIVAFTIISWMTDCIFNCSFANFGTLSSLIVLGTHAHQLSNAFIDGQFDPMDHYRNLLNFFHLSNGFDVTFFISYTIAHFTTFEIEQKPFTATSYWFWWIAADCSNLIILQFGFPSFVCWFSCADDSINHETFCDSDPRWLWNMHVHCSMIKRETQKRIR